MSTERPDARERHDIGLVALGPGDELLVGRKRELGGVLRDEVGLLLLAVEADRFEELLVLLAVGIEEDAVVAGAELGRVPFFDTRRGVPPRAATT